MSKISTKLRLAKRDSCRIARASINIWGWRLFEIKRRLNKGRPGTGVRAR